MQHKARVATIQMREGGRILLLVADHVLHGGNTARYRVRAIRDRLAERKMSKRRHGGGEATWGERDALGNPNGSEDILRKWRVENSGWYPKPARP